MSGDHAILLLLLAGMIGLFLWGRWRHDGVALGALLAAVLTGLVPAHRAFSGFGHPAIVTVAAVLVMGYGLKHTGVADAFARRLLPRAAGPALTILALIGAGALLSSVMNNVGALALLMPVAVQAAARLNLPPGKLLMPLAFASILGGMTTLIGTPANLIVSGFRAADGLGPFALFDFAPVGLAVTGLGVLFIAVVGWRWVPTRKTAVPDSFDSGACFSEVRVPEGSPAVRKKIREIESLLDAADAQIIALVRQGVHIPAPHPGRILSAGDILVIEVDPRALGNVLTTLGAKLEEEAPLPVGAPAKDAAAASPAKEGATRSDEPVVQELVVMPDSTLLDRSATDMDLRTRYGINLLAISRQGRRTIKRLRTTHIQAGDVLLVQGEDAALTGFAAEHECLPLAPRNIRVPKPRQMLAATLTMGAAVAAAALGAPAELAFSAGALAFVAFRLVPLRAVYTAIDWPVIVLLAALLPIAETMTTTGAADRVARVLLDHVARGQAVPVLALLLVLTMALTNLMNNAATSAVMAPIALGIAHQLGVRPEPFLMAVATGASAAFLTPIGHQNNTLILGPGGFRFADYWRLGLPLSLLIAAVAVPLILRVWPP